jgi:hypothetical protein
VRFASNCWRCRRSLIAARVSGNTLDGVAVAPALSPSDTLDRRDLCTLGCVIALRAQVDIWSPVSLAKTAGAERRRTRASP